MNTDLASAVELADNIVAACGQFTEKCDIAIFPPFPYLQAVGHTLGNHNILLGAQDVYFQPNGAYTGEVSTQMLLDLNVKVVLIGHSERRHVILEGDDLINSKLLAVLEAGLSAVLCVGETLAQRDAGETDQVNVSQLTSGLRNVTEKQMQRVTIAYEPVWAIGTGKVAKKEDAASAHAVIRQSISDLYSPNIAQQTRIQYGGSVNAKNASELFLESQIDGGLVGGASLDSGQFAAIVQAAI